MIRERTVAPADKAVSLDDIRTWLAFDAGITEDNDVLDTVIDETTAYLEGGGNGHGELNGRKLYTQTWTITLDACEIADILPIRLSPLQSVTSIKTTDADGVVTTVDTSNYQVRIGEYPRVVLSASGSWPSDTRDYDALQITCVVGYGDQAAMPNDIRMILKGVAQHQYKSKGTGIVATESGYHSLPFQIKEMIQAKRLSTQWV